MQAFALGPWKAIMKKENLHANHRQRMRKRYKAQGLDGFSDHEALEILLYYCYPRCDTNEIAHKMLREFKSLQNLFDANVETLMTRLGCTENIAVLLSLMPAIAKRYMQSKWGDKVVLNTPEIAGAYSISLFVGEQVENFYVLCLDKQLRLNHTSLIAKGTIDEVPIFTRELVRMAIEYQAINIILVHNHPGGTIKPSLGDDSVTTKIRDALALIDVAVTDHIIVAGDQYFSYAQRGRKNVDGYYS